MTLKEAITIAEKDNPKYFVIGGAEYKSIYGLTMYPRTKPDNWGNGSVYCINKKSSKGEWVNGGELFDIYGMPIRILEDEEIESYSGN